jgi:formate hydrogenlyase subunit 4
MIPRFEWTNARSIDDAIDQINSKALVKAGGVDLMDRLKEGQDAPSRLVNIRTIAGHDYVKEESGWLRIGPMVTLAAVTMALMAVPLGGLRAPLAFTGDLVLLAYLLGVGRFFTVAAALDTGSAFEGMGASREVMFSALVEPVMFIALAALVKLAGTFSLSELYAALTPAMWVQGGPALALAAVALFGVMLTENSRIPVDDPTTHLELTMIHEVMVLDHSGPDFAFILYGAALKLWAMGALLVGVVIPARTGSVLCDVAAFLLGMVAVAVAVGVVESTMARLRLLRVPQMLIGAGSLAVLAIFLALRV